MEDIVVALIRRAHGLKGELQIHPRTDEPESGFEGGREVRIAGDGGPRGLPGVLTLEWARPHGRTWRAKFAEIGDRTLAERYAGKELVVARDELREPEENEFFVHDLIGYEVRLADGTLVGQVGDYYDASGTVLLGVTADGKERLIPFTGAVVSSVSAEERRIVIDPPDGLLEI